MVRTLLTFMTVAALLVSAPACKKKDEAAAPAGEATKAEKPATPAEPAPAPAAPET